MYFNREEKSLRHITMVAKFLDDNKPVKSLKSLFALFQISPILFNILFNLANLGGIFFLGLYLSLSNFRKTATIFVFCLTTP